MIGVSKDTGIVAEINPATGAWSNMVSLQKVEFPPDYGAYDGLRSLAKHPGTGVIYGILGGNPAPLVTVDPSTGAFTAVAETGSEGNVGWLTTLTFGAGPDYPLYGIIGGGDDSGGVSGSIHIIDTATGTPTATGWATSGAGGHAIEFNPDDGLIYHFYNPNSPRQNNADETPYLETIDPSDGTVVQVPLSGNNHYRVNAITYAGGGVFYTHYSKTGTYFKITSAGAVTISRDTADNDVRAIDYIGPDQVLTHDEKSFYEINLVTGAISNLTPFGPPVLLPPRLYSIARDPSTGDYWTVTDPPYPDLRTACYLARIDIATGALSNEVLLSETGIMGITFGTDGTLYGIASLLPQSGGTIDRGTIVTIDPTTGTVAATVANSLMNDLNHSLVFNPDDGKLYRFYGHSVTGATMDSFDPITKALTTIGALNPQPATTNIRGAVYKGGGEFYIIDSSSSIYTVTTAGVVTPRASYLTDFFEGLAFADELVPPPAPDFVPPSLRFQNAKQLRTPRSRHTIKGLAVDNVGVARVEVKSRLQKGWRKAKLRPSGKFQFKTKRLKSGRNVHQFRAIDTGGNRSKVMKAKPIGK